MSDGVATTTSSARDTVRQFWDAAGMLLVFAALFAGLSLTVDRFLSVDNMIGLALSVSMVGMVACTMLFCLASGDFDLSVEAVVAFAGVLAAVDDQRHRQRRPRHRWQGSRRAGWSGWSTASSSPSCASTP